MSVEENSKIMRKFHNYVKFLLYKKYCKPDSTLLDLGCGRGGDMVKWHNTNITKVVGIDINKPFIIDAIKRYNQNKDLQNRDYMFYFTVSKHIFTDFLKMKNLSQVYDNISCMFALHYFFNNRENVMQIFSQISNTLQNGGYFIGTVMNGNKVQKLIEDAEVYNSTSMFIRREFSQQMNYGSKISFMLSGTLYFGEKTLSTEYLVFEHVLREVGNIYKLKLIEYNCFSDYHTNQFPLSPDFETSSYLNYTFAFQKIT